eukprot:scaffold70929_cov18-Tisochrysis_lutea.AAC.2
MQRMHRVHHPWSASSMECMHGVPHPGHAWSAAKACWSLKWASSDRQSKAAITGPKTNEASMIHCLHICSGPFRSIKSFDPHVSIVEKDCMTSCVEAQAHTLSARGSSRVSARDSLFLKACNDAASLAAYMAGPLEGLPAVWQQHEEMVGRDAEEETLEGLPAAHWQQQGNTYSF